MITHGVYEGYKKTKRKYPEHTADYQSHETCFYRKTPESQRAGRTDRSLFSVYVPDGKFHFSTQRQYGSSILKKRGIQKKAIVVLTSNRGLAGGYNANVVKLITESDDVAKEDVVIYAVGRKGIEILERKGYHIEVDASEIMENPTYPDAAALCKRVLDDFAEGKIGEIYLAYTHFKNTVSQEAQLIRMLPVEVSEPSEEKYSREILMNYEPNEQEALNQIIPKYVTSLFYGALVEAVASENGARMQAMDSATSNAEDMIEDLSLKYNRARQGSITQELTEIIAGANAIE